MITIYVGGYLKVKRKIAREKRTFYRCEHDETHYKTTYTDYNFCQRCGSKIISQNEMVDDALYVDKIIHTFQPAHRLARFDNDFEDGLEYLYYISDDVHLYKETIYSSDGDIEMCSFFANWDEIVDIGEEFERTYYDTFCGLDDMRIEYKYSCGILIGS